MGAGPVLAVGGVVVAPGDDGRLAVVMVRRGRPPNEGGWSLPGGRVEPGETLAAALAREMLEETGLVVEVGPLLLVAELIEPTHHYVVLDYACAEKGGSLAPGDDAAAALRVPIDELAARGATALVIEAVRRASSFLVGLGGI